MKDLVTAIITTHKRKPETVARALDSVLAQTYQNIEVIVVDDSPADYPLRSAVRELVVDRGVTYIAHETCQGACVARNTGINHAKGKFIALLDDDDEWKPEKIEEQIKGFTTDDIGLVYCSCDILDVTTGAIREYELEMHEGMVFDKLIFRNFVGPTYPMLRTEALCSIGGFDPVLKSAQDYDVWLRIAERYAFSYVKGSYSIYYVNSSDQISMNYVCRISGQEQLIKKNLPYLKRHRKAYARRIIGLAPEYAGNKQRGKALWTWTRGFFTWPWALRENAKYLYHTLRNLF